MLQVLDTTVLIDHLRGRPAAARGLTLWQADCLIAAVSVLAGAPLATGNPKDFPMAELEVHHWPVGDQLPCRRLVPCGPPSC